MAQVRKGARKGDGESLLTRRVPFYQESPFLPGVTQKSRGVMAKSDFWGDSSWKHECKFLLGEQSTAGIFPIVILNQILNSISIFNHTFALVPLLGQQEGIFRRH